MKDFVDKQYRGSVPIHCMPSFEPVREDDAFHDIGNQHKLDKGPSLANELYKKRIVFVWWTSLVGALSFWFGCYVLALRFLHML